MATVAIGLAATLSGCVGVHGTRQIGRPLDQARLAQIIPGTTTVREVMSWFGPPDYVIDGSRSMIDEAKFWADMPTFGKMPRRSVPTRPLLAPGDTLILIYSTSSGEVTAGRLAGGLIAVDQDWRRARPGEVFVLISKLEHVVLAVADGNAPNR